MKRQILKYILYQKLYISFEYFKIMWGPGAEPLVGSRGEALDGCSRILLTIYFLKKSR
jgi:hypothetical protein